MSEAADLAKAALSRGDLIAAYDATVAAIEDGDDERRDPPPAGAGAGADGRHRAGDGAVRGLRPRPVAATRTSARSAPACSRTGRWRCAGRRAAASRSSARSRPITPSIGRAAIPFPGINAATLALLAGDEERARELAAALLADPAVAAAGDYYMAVTRAEALLILGRTDGGRRGAARRGRCAASRDHGARSGTRAPARHGRRRISASTKPARAALLAPLAPPRAMHFCGHMFAADAAAEARLQRGDRRDARRGGCRLRLRRARLRRRHPDRRGRARPRRRAPRRAAVRRGGFPRPVGAAGRRGLGGALPRLPRRAPRASPSPARWSISATPPNMAMAAGWRWAWRGCAPQHLAAEPVQIAIWDGAPSRRAGRHRRRRRRLGGAGRTQPRSSIPARSTASLVRPRAARHQPPTSARSPRSCSPISRASRR